MKHNLVEYHVEIKIVHLRHCSTNDQIVDIFTKSVGREKLVKLKEMVGLTNTPLD